MTTDEPLYALAENCGLQTTFWDWKSNLTHTPASGIKAILAAMGIDASTPESIADALRGCEDRPWRHPLPACTVTEQGRPARVNVHVPAGAPATLSIQLEDGGRADAWQVDNLAPDRQVDGQMIGEATFELPTDLPTGYHRLALYSDSLLAESSLIVTPSYLGLPPAVGRRTIWGYAAQLYSVRSAGSWGVGDLADLAALATWAATQQQADYVLINPLHAAEPDPPMEPSPYLPTTRHFINPLYIRPETIPEYADVLGAARTKLRGLRRAAIARAARSDLLQRDAVWAAKRQALRIVYDAGLPPARRMAFDAYRRAAGRELRDFAVWTVLCTQLGPNWHQWPVVVQRPTSPTTAAFAAQHADEVAFVEWQQWVAQDQLGYAQHVAREAGMRVGIVTDLAVGVNPDGADTWILADVYAKGVQVGAPPDAYNQLGQTWGQPPWLPTRLADLAYVPFRQIVRAAMAQAGGVRIDHILGLFRLWWVPEGNTPDQGCYVRYDHEALVGIVALEAQRAGAMIVGEDLGTVEPWVRQYLARRGILGTTVLWFECDQDGQPLPPDGWRPTCMASVTTHDLPPTAGFLALDHVRLRHELGLLTEPLDIEMATARDDQQFWLDYLQQQGYVSNQVDGVPIDTVEAEVLGLHQALAASAAQVRCVALVDAIGDKRVQNQPGTIDEYPNWRVPLCDQAGHPMTLEDVFASPRAMRLAAVMNDWTHVPAPFWQGEKS